MASASTQINLSMKFLSSLLLLYLMIDATVATARSRMNVIDGCWRKHPNWVRNRALMATCSIGFAGKMSNNVGRDMEYYIVTDPTDDSINPRPGTLRYGATLIDGKVWISFQRNMNITLQKPLLISSFTAIDGRGANVHIARGACFMLYRVSNVIVHGLHIHHCQKPFPGPVIAPGRKIINLGGNNGDAIKIIGSSKIWIDHNTLFRCKDGLVDATQGSTDVTISNNWFRNQDKVMLLGHDDSYAKDKMMKVTLVYNHFGPNCRQRMPRARYGYVHVANNLYLGWGLYAIGGSMNPSIRSESNVYISNGKKEVAWRNGSTLDKKSWNWISKNDEFINGAHFRQSGCIDRIKPNYNRYQSFPVENTRMVREITSSSGAIKCTRSRC